MRGTAEIHWVNSGAMIANSLTKTKEKGQPMLYLASGFQWKIVFDENFIPSGKGSKQAVMHLKPFAHKHIQKTRRRQDLGFHVSSRKMKSLPIILEMGTNANFIQVSFHVTLGSGAPLGLVERSPVVCNYSMCIYIYM